MFFYGTNVKSKVMVRTGINKVLIGDAWVINVVHGWSNDRCQNFELAKYALYVYDTLTQWKSNPAIADSDKPTAPFLYHNTTA